MPGTFVSVGNAHQAFTRLISVVFTARDSLPQPIIVQHGDTPCDSHALNPVAFLSPAEYEKQILDADIVIMHAGAGSILHAIQAGKVPIVMARLKRYGEIVDDHQLEFSGALAAEGRVVLIHDGAELEQAAKEALRRQSAMPDQPSPPRLVGLVGEVLERCAREVK